MAVMKKNIWFFNAHPDDINAGLGLALVLKELDEYRVCMCGYTRGEGGLRSKGVPFDECAAIRTLEEQKVCAALGVEPVFLPEKNDGSCAAGIETCKIIAGLLTETPPAAIITHWPVDTHPDHVMCTAAVIKAVRMCGLKTEIYFYRQNGQSHNFPQDYYLPFDEKIMTKKCELLKLYKSQNGEQIAQRQLTEDTFNGYRCYAPFAECYAGFRFQTDGEEYFFADLADVRKKAGTFPETFYP